MKKCKICGKQYVREDYYKKHMIEEHGIDLSQINEEQIIVEPITNEDKELIINDLPQETTTTRGEESLLTDIEEEKENILTEEEYKIMILSEKRFRMNGSYSKDAIDTIKKVYKIATNKEAQFPCCKWKNIYTVQTAINYFIKNIKRDE